MLLILALRRWGRRITNWMLAWAVQIRSCSPSPLTAIIPVAWRIFVSHTELYLMRNSLRNSLLWTLPISSLFTTHHFYITALSFGGNRHSLGWQITWVKIDRPRISVSENKNPFWSLILAVHSLIPKCFLRDFVPYCLARWGRGIAWIRL